MKAPERQKLNKYPNFQECLLTFSAYSTPALLNSRSHAVLKNHSLIKKAYGRPERSCKNWAHRLQINLIYKGYKCFSIRTAKQI